MRPVAWTVALLVAAAGIAFGLRGPGDIANWVAPLALLPLGYVAFITFEDRWAGASRRARVLVWLATAALAVAGGTWYVLVPTDGSWVVGGLLSVPLLVVTPLLDRGAGEPDDAGTSGAISGGPFGPP